VPYRFKLVPLAGLLALSFVPRLRADETPAPDPAGPAVSGEPALPADPAPPDDPTVAGDPAVAPGPAAFGPPAFDGPVAEPDPEKPYWRTNLFKRAWMDQKFLFTTWWPSEFKRYQFTVPLLAGITLVAAHGDSRRDGPDFEVKQYIQGEASEHGASVQQSFSFIGNTGPACLLLGIGYLTGRWSHHDRLSEASSLSAEGLLSTGLYVTVLKHLTARTRPNAGADGGFFTYHAEPGQVVGSFPSGHAAGAFTVATVFAETYRDHPWVGWVTYGAAGMVGWARVAQGRHFLGDVIVGGLIGHSVGRMVTARGREEKPPAFELQPFIDPNGQGGGVLLSKIW
jgi:membrane-associated phospholipid phosphatase